jgi:hypothetical protein
LIRVRGASSIADLDSTVVVERSPIRPISSVDAAQVAV